MNNTKKLVVIGAKVRPEIRDLLRAMAQQYGFTSPSELLRAIVSSALDHPTLLELTCLAGQNKGNSNKPEQTPAGKASTPTQSQNTENSKFAVNGENALLRWLWLQGADCKQESQVSIVEALAYCCKTFDISERTASRDFEQLERNGRIGRLNAPGVTKIWLGQNFKIESIDDKMDFSLYDLCAARVASVSSVDKPPTVITGATGATRATLYSELGICKNTSEKPKRPDFEVGAYA